MFPYLLRLMRSLRKLERPSPLEWNSVKAEQNAEVALKSWVQTRGLEYDIATLHDKRGTAKLSNVFGRIPCDPDRVSEIAGLETAELILLAKNCGADRGCACENLRRRHPKPGHPHEFPHIGAMGEHADVAAAANRNGFGQSIAEATFRHLHRLRGIGFARNVSANVRSDGFWRAERG